MVGGWGADWGGGVGLGRLSIGARQARYIEFSIENLQQGNHLFTPTHPPSHQKYGKQGKTGARLIKYISLAPVFSFLFVCPVVLTLFPHCTLAVHLLLSCPYWNHIRKIVV